MSSLGPGPLGKAIDGAARETRGTTWQHPREGAGSSSLSLSHNERQAHQFHPSAHSPTRIGLRAAQHAARGAHALVKKHTTLSNTQSPHPSPYAIVAWSVRHSTLSSISGTRRTRTLFAGSTRRCVRQYGRLI